LVTALVGVGILVVLIGFTLGSSFIKPGPLSTPHAQILSGSMDAKSCAACHPGANSSLMSWFMTGHDAHEPMQTDRCMDCHHARLPRQYARMAHNLSPNQLQAATANAQPVNAVSWKQWLPKPAFAQNDVACSVCHQEHAGADANLSVMTSEQCQTCHQSRFDSFATDHPGWDRWPYESDGIVEFNHQTHSRRHHPGTIDASGNPATFDCQQCHPKTEDQNFAIVSSYEIACATCHDAALRQQTSERMDLFVVPSLGQPDLAVVGRWPPSATGFFDGDVGPLARFLMRDDAVLSDAIESLDGGKLSRVNPASESDRRAAQEIAVGIRDRIRSMAQAGPLPATESASTLRAPLRELLRGLSPQLIAAATESWFENRERPAMFRNASALMNDDDLLSDDLPHDDPLLAPYDSATTLPATDDVATPKRLPTTPSRYDPAKAQPDGGWYIDDVRLAISYRGSGHSDPVIRSAVELAVGLPPEDSVRRDLLSIGPAVACLECHRPPRSQGNMVWQNALPITAPAPSFTKFSHRPHMNLPALADCKHCHAINDNAIDAETTDMTTVSLSDFVVPPHDFLPMAKHVCASCHTPQAAGDDCTKCHRYHIEAPPRF